jgi:hypothetical protein
MMALGNISNAPQAIAGVSAPAVFRDRRIGV